MRITRRTTVLAEAFGWVLGVTGLLALYAAVAGRDWSLGLIGVAAGGLATWIVWEMRALRPRL